MPSEPSADAAGALRIWRRELRLRLIAAREAMPAAEHAAKSDLIEAALAQLLIARSPCVVGFCWPYRAEFDARALIGRWLAQDASRRAALPVIVQPRAPLVFRQWRGDSPMRDDRHGIAIPVSGASLHPDLLLLPLVGFDLLGYRLGYGGGYFDRTMSLLNPRPLAVGVGFELGRLDSIRPQNVDARLDYVVTEAGATQQGQKISAPL